VHQEGLSGLARQIQELRHALCDFRELRQGGESGVGQERQRGRPARAQRQQGEGPDRGLLLSLLFGMAHRHAVAAVIDLCLTTPGTAID